MATRTGTGGADSWPGSVDNSGDDDINGWDGDDTLYGHCCTIKIARI